MFENMLTMKKDTFSPVAIVLVLYVWTLPSLQDQKCPRHALLAHTDDSLCHF